MFMPAALQNKSWNKESKEDTKPDNVPTYHKEIFSDISRLRGKIATIPQNSRLIHELAYYGKLPRVKKELLTKELLLEADDKGNTVMHYAAFGGHIRDIPSEFHARENFSLKNTYGNTVYHFIATAKNAGSNIKWTAEILELTNSHNTSVLCTLAKSDQLHKVPKELLTIERLTQQDNSKDFALKYAALGTGIKRIPKKLLTLEALEIEDENGDSALSILIYSNSKALPKNIREEALDIQPLKSNTVLDVECLHKEDVISITGEEITVCQAEQLISKGETVGLITIDPCGIGDRITVHPVGKQLLTLLAGELTGMETTWLGKHHLWHVRTIKYLYLEELTDYPLGANQILGIIKEDSPLFNLPRLQAGTHSEILPHAKAAWSARGKVLTLPKFVEEFEEESYNSDKMRARKNLEEFQEKLAEHIGTELDNKSAGSFPVLEFGIQQDHQAVLAATCHRKLAPKQKEEFIELGERELLEQCEKAYSDSTKLTTDVASTEISLF